ncbi:hypothetical protein EDD85DRAFT_952341 [Armillaria nabsnona]|nr:hypothetical protein EDD85DRAFT_952341 [Armillaria nabsnona]
MDTLVHFKLIDLFCGLVLCSQIYCITCQIPAAQCVRAWDWKLTSFKHSQNMYDFNETLCIPGDSGYAPDNDLSVGEADLHPFCLAIVPPPIKPVATLSLSKSGDVAGPSTLSQQVPKPKMICTPQAPKEPTFASPTKKQVSVSPPVMRKCPRAPELVKPAPAPKTKKVSPANSQAPTPFKTQLAIKKPVVDNLSSDSKAKSEDEDEEDAMVEGIEEALEEEEWLSDEIKAPPIKKPRLEPAAGANPPPPHVYHPLTGMPLSGLLYVPFSAPTDPAPPLPPAESTSKAKGMEKAVAPGPLHLLLFAVTNKSPITSGSKVAAAATTAASLEADHVDNTIYTRAFHLQVDLQFHEPPSCQALELMKLSMLPSTPDSLTKAPTQVCNGQEYVYWCHSDLDPHFICPLLLTWPCYNCTLSGYPDECEFEGGVGEEVCTKCKTGRHSPCSMHWDANQLCRAAALLDPLTLSSDGAICHGVDHVKRINAELALLGRAMHCLCEDCEKIIGELADGLNVIASHEHGTEIINAYTQVSDFLKSFVVHLGEAGGDSDVEGEASESGAA